MRVPRWDVNGDGDALADRLALLVINQLNRAGTRAVPDIMVQYDTAAPYWDVSNDRYVSPSDALV